MQCPPPSEVPAPLAPPESRQCYTPSPGHSRLSSPALVTCLGESLLAGVGLNKYNTDAAVFDGSDRELYKYWKRAVHCKLKMSTCLYPAPESGVQYMALRLAGVAADILKHAIEKESLRQTMSCQPSSYLTTASRTRTSTELRWLPGNVSS